MISNYDLGVRFFLQLAVILAVCRGVGWLARLIHQPQVVGEMIAGVLLGPSLFGLLLPEAQKWLFPPQSMSILFAVSQMGLSVYMFLVGVEFRTDLFRSHLKSAATTSLAGMIVPFLLGGGLGVWLLDRTGFFGPNTHAPDAAIFMGAAMAITAFPMLARIIYERGLTGTTLGTLALAAGAIDDAAAWCALAVVLASFDHDWGVAIRAILGGIAYLAFTLTLGRRALAVLRPLMELHQRTTQSMLAWVLLLIMIGSWVTDAIRIYAVFGAFIMGVAMPRGLFAREIVRLLEPFTVVFLLPLFFTYSGLNTRLDMVNTPELFLISLAVLAAACLGKGGACYAMARLGGEDHRTALAVGTLMNARGLMELIILNIGLQRGIILPTLFSIMVLMAILTTLGASPMFEWVYGAVARREGRLGATPVD